ncbi:MAG: FkbM family methyltransferase [Candidatus Azotimanducaceae bacterium]
MNGTLRFIAAHPLTQNQQSKARWRFLKWQVVSRFSSDRLVVPWLHGLRLSVQRGDTGLTGNIYCGLHEFWEMMFALHYLLPGDLFIDAGANLGAYSLLAAGIAGTDVLAVEPIPATYRRLSDNIALNQLDKRITAHQVGLADQPGTLRFSNLADSAVNRVVSNGGIEVPVTTLDGLLGDKTPGLVKLDVEGFEEAVLAGASNLLDQGCPILMETLERRDFYLALMGEHGYRPSVYEPFSRQLLPADTITNNTLFIRDMAHCEDRIRNAKPISVLGHII